MTVFRALALSVAILIVLMSNATAGQFDIEENYIACLNVPEYALGGSMAGDCMTDQSAELDVQIETMLARSAKKYCRASDRESIAASQSDWLKYREGYCTLIENSPGNTGAWINGGACRLDLTQKRLESLFFLTDHAYSWCRQMRLLGTLSHFGDPSGRVMRDKDTGITWSTSDNGDRRSLDISGGQASLGANIDITSCSYCDSGADCNDGVFAFSREGSDGALNYSIAHLCTVELNGPRLDIVDLTPAATPLRTTIDAKRHIAWTIDEGRLRIVVEENEDALYWPPSKPDD